MNQMDCKCKQMLAISGAICIAIVVFFGNSLGGYGITLFMLGMIVAGLFYSLSSEFSSDILGNMQAKRRKKGQFRNVLLLRRNMTVIMVFFSILVGGLMYFYADTIAGTLLGLPLSVSAIRRVCPLLLLFAIGTSLQAFFKGNGQYITCIIQAVVRPIGYLFLGFAFVNRQQEYGEKVARLLKAPEKESIYTVNGMITAMVITELILVVILFLLYLASNNGKDRRKSNEGTKLTEGTFDMIRNYLSQALFPILVFMMLLVPSILGIKKLLEGADVETVKSVGGHIFSGYTILLVILMFMVAKARSLTLKIYNIKKHQDNRRMKRALEVTSYFSVRIGIFLCITCMILAKFFIDSYYAWAEDVDQAFVYILMLSILPICVSSVSMAIMNLQGRRFFSTLMVLTVLIVGCLLMNFYPASAQNPLVGFATAFTISAYLLMALSLGYVLFQRFYQVNVSYMLIVPFMSGAISGIVSILILKLISPHIGEGVSFFVGLILSVMVYFGVLSAVKNVTSQDIQFLYDKKAQAVLKLFIK